ncbi:MAG TPA: peptidylprolyl isomerase [Vicinamibacteria bacterium]|nr:peptidylprolyl isomerase [Vicinamibacteria bacterium]
MALLVSKAAVVLLSLGLGCRPAPVAQQPPISDGGDPVLLALGEHTVRRSDFERHMAAVEARGGVPLTAEVRRALLEAYLEEKVLVLEARARGLAQAPGEAGETEAVRRLLSDAVLSQVSVTAAEIDGYCRDHLREFDVPERVRLRQILVPTPNEARDVVRRLRKQPRSFAQLAQTRSRGPEASTGGVMGLFARGELPPELERAAFALAAGDTSDVVSSPLGYHVLRVEERVPAREAGLPECREASRAELLRRKSDEGVREFVRGLLARAKVNHEALTGPRPS